MIYIVKYLDNKAYWNEKMDGWIDVQKAIIVKY